MSILDLFRRRKITAQDVRLEKIRLENREKKLAAEIDALSREKEEIFRKGAETTSKQLRVVYARRFEESTRRLSLLERESVRIWKMVRLITALHHAFEHSGKGPGSNLLSRLSDAQMAEIIRMIEADEIRGEVFSEKLDEMVGMVEGIESQREGVGEEGQEILRVWEKMDEGEIEFEEGLKEASEKEKEKPSS
jgi:hypothetical protein